MSEPPIEFDEELTEIMEELKDSTSAARAEVMRRVIARLKILQRSKVL